MVEPHFESWVASDGYVGALRRWPVAGRPRARVVFLHGIQSHGGWYHRSCEHLNAAGFEVYFLDRRGCGRNPVRRGDTPSFRRLIDDVVEFMRPLRATGSPPLRLAGISWGGKLAASVCSRAPGLIDGLALLCPGLCPRVGTPLGTQILIGRARIRFPRQYFDIPLNDPKLFTASPDWQRFIADDPLALRKATARFFVENLRFNIYLRRRPPRLRVPVLLQLAERDRIINNRATRRFALQYLSPATRIIEYPGASHTLEFEPPGHPFLDDLTQWLGG